MTPTSTAMLLPAVSLVVWTLLVSWLVPIRRRAAVRAGRLSSDDFRYGESGNVPASVRLPNRDFVNLLELPTLFYFGCVVAVLTQRMDSITVTLAWVFVVTRLGHSIVHLTYNHIGHRARLFYLGSAVLLVFWLRLGWAMLH